MGVPVCKKDFLKMILPFLALFLFVNVEAIPKGRAARAISPEYQFNGISGWKKCVVKNPEKYNGNEYCLPTVKLHGCSNEAWEEFKRAYDPNDSQNPGGDVIYFDADSGAPPPDFGAPPGAQPLAEALPAPPFAGGPPPVGLPAPKYLSIKGVENCLKDHTPDGASHQAWCLPANQPKYCSDPSWAELLDSGFTPDGQPDCPDPADIPGFIECTIPASSDESPSCIPFWNQPLYCSDDSWKEIHAKVFQFV